MNNFNVFPRKTEKSYRLTADNVYVFDVPTIVNTNQIVDVIEEQYGVKVSSIRTLTQKGKAIRFSKGKKSYPGTTFRKDFKKAYVTLVEGDKIKMFDEEVKEEPSVKADKKEKK